MGRGDVVGETETSGQGADSGWWSGENDGQSARQRHFGGSLPKQRGGGGLGVSVSHEESNQAGMFMFKTKPKESSTQENTEEESDNSGMDFWLGQGA